MAEGSGYDTLQTKKKIKGEDGNALEKKNCIALTLIFLKNQNLGEKTKTLVGQGLHKFVEAIVI